MKAKMVELIKNYHKWFDLEYEICYFFNVYGPGQIMKGDYATVVGIFERQFKAGQKCTVVSPGNQTRDFTHIKDVVRGISLASKKSDNHEWFLRSGVNVSMIELAEMFGKWELIPERRGERFTSEYFETDTESRLGWKPKHELKNWIDKVKQKISNGTE
jgi:UDP-glucose 4-epimerase